MTDVKRQDCRRFEPRSPIGKGKSQQSQGKGLESQGPRHGDPSGGWGGVGLTGWVCPLSRGATGEEIGLVWDAFPMSHPMPLRLGPSLERSSGGVCPRKIGDPTSGPAPGWGMPGFEMGPYRRFWQVGWVCQKNLGPMPDGSGDRIGTNPISRLSLCLFHHPLISRPQKISHTHFCKRIWFSPAIKGTPRVPGVPFCRQNARLQKASLLRVFAHYCHLALRDVA